MRPVIRQPMLLSVFARNGHRESAEGPVSFAGLDMPRNFS